VPDGVESRDATSMHGKRIATTYPHILGRYLRQRDVQAEIVTLSGAVEIAPRLGRADFICDLVSTGSTLLANHLWEAETILESQAAIISTPVPVSPEKQDWIHRLSLRIDGVQQVKESKYIMLHAPRSKLADIRKLLPGSESPTIVPLDGTGDKVAVHAVCRENVFWETLESLKNAGASAILVDANAIGTEVGGQVTNGGLECCLGDTHDVVILDDLLGAVIGERDDVAFARREQRRGAAGASSDWLGSKGPVPGD
jgi:ATP phosphoribosyltransferase